MLEFIVVGAVLGFFWHHAPVAGAALTFCAAFAYIAALL